MQCRHQGHICSAPVQRVKLLFSMEVFGLGSSNKGIVSALQSCCSVHSFLNGERTCQSQRYVFLLLMASSHSSIFFQAWSLVHSLQDVFFFFFFFLQPHVRQMEAPGLGAKQSCSCDLYHNHGNTKSEPHLQPMPQLVEMPDT